MPDLIRYAAEAWLGSRNDVNPFVFGPRDGQIWEHGWWIAQADSAYAELAYSKGSGIGVGYRTVDVCASGDVLDAGVRFRRAFGNAGAFNVINGTDKITAHSYELVYADELKGFIDKPVRLLEIGVLTGASLTGWREFLGEHALIIGVDSDVTHNKNQRELVIHMDITDSSAPDFLRKLGPFDVIIDDGSHRLRDQLTAFNNLWDMLGDGGVYVIEDISDIDAFVKAFPGRCDLRLHDLRSVKGRHDDVCAVFRKSVGDRRSVTDGEVAHIHMATSFTDDFKFGEKFLAGARRWYPYWKKFRIANAVSESTITPFECINGMAQHGAFIRHWPELCEDDIVMFTDCDAVLQRPFTPAELALMTVSAGEFAAAVNQVDENTTLEFEASLLVETIPYEALDAEFPGWRSMVVRNAGFLVGRVGDWEKLHELVRAAWPKVEELLPHRSSIQWLICYIIHKHFKMKTLPRTIHANGHSGLEGAYKNESGQWCIDDTVIAFAHAFHIHE